MATDFREGHLWIIVFLPFCGYFISYLYDRYGQSFASGNNLLFDTIDDPTKDKIPLLKAVFIYFGTILTHLFGGSAGREGTALQMAGSIADQFTSILKLSVEDRKTLIIASIAAGFGAVFGTPMAGAIFAVEVLVRGRLQYRYLFPALVAGFFANMVGDIFNSPHTHYEIASAINYSISNVGSAVLAGICFGLVARFFIFSMHYLAKRSHQMIPNNPIRTFLGGLLVLGFFALIQESKFVGLGVPTIVSSFDQHLPTFDFALKLIFTVITLSFGFKGGEVTPLFFIGATLGNALFPITTLPLDVLAGMGFVGVFAGATKTPIACTILAIELFGWEAAIFVSIGCIVSYHISGVKSIYSSQKL
jgi:H+/Cl- antiporter ClcA